MPLLTSSVIPCMPAGPPKKKITEQAATWQVVGGWWLAVGGCWRLAARAGCP